MTSNKSRTFSLSRILVKVVQLYLKVRNRLRVLKLKRRLKAQNNSAVLVLEASRRRKRPTNSSKAPKRL